MTPPDTKERIVDAGAKAIVAKSYNGCGLKEILDAAGVPKGSFYHYFKSKEDFGVAIIEESAEMYAQMMREILNDRASTPLERIRAYFGMVREHHSQCGPKQCPIAKLALEVGQLSEPMRAAIKHGFDHWSSLLAKTIREAQCAGDVADVVDADRAARLLINGLEGVSIRMQIDQNLEPLDEFIDFVFARLLTAE